MDLADQAQAVEELDRRLALERHQRAEILETAENCIDCGAMIPSKRQAAVPGTQYCTGCAEAHEAMERHYRRFLTTI